LILRGGDPARHALRWRLSHGGTASMGDLRDPATGAPALRLCLYDASGALQPLLAVTVPPGGVCGSHACWKVLGGPGGYRYKNKAATPEGITDLKLKLSGLGELQLLARGKGTSRGMPALGLVTPVTAQLTISEGDESACWDAAFVAPSKNDAALFRSKSP
jgi:hypothetical protein